MEVFKMKRMLSVVLGIVAVSAVVFAQAPDPALEKALLPAPRNLQAAATVIKWKSDFTYDTLRKGTNRLVCYERSGLPEQQPFSVECTAVANLDREAQNLKAEAVGDRTKTQAMLNDQE